MRRSSKWDEVWEQVSGKRSSSSVLSPKDANKERQDGKSGLDPVREESKANLFAEDGNMREFELKYINSDEDDPLDPLNRALQNVREIPLESYMSEDKAM